MPSHRCCQETLYDALLALPKDSPAFRILLHRSRTLFKRDMFDRLFDEYQLDFLVAPADSTVLAAFAAGAGYVTVHAL